jgi:sarcosine oxidase subunit gamma
MINASAHMRRTPLRRLLEGHDADWIEFADAAVAERVDAAANARTLAIADLSPLPRLGFKGRGTIQAMKKRAVVVETEPNRAFRQPDGGLCLVLGPGEVMLLANLAGDAEWLHRIEAGWRIEDEERTYPVPRRDSHAWLAVTGSAAPAFFAKLTAIDLRLDKFADLAIAQTSMAKMTAIIARADLGVTPVFHVLADSASALYLCSCLMDAAREFQGGIVGIAALRELRGS